MSNRTFSIVKDRELSSLEAGIESLRRRLTNPLRRRTNLERRAVPTTFQGHSAAMPRRKSRREEIGDWESGAEDSYLNGSGGNSSGNPVGAEGVGEREDGNDNDHGNNTSGGRTRQRRAGSYEHRQKTDLGLWTEAVDETLQTMEAAKRTIKDLQDKFASHVDDLTHMEQTRTRLIRLEKECQEKDNDINRCESTITTLTGINQKNQTNIDHQMEKIKEEKQALDQERSKLGKRVTTAMAEEKSKLQAEFDKLVTERSQSLDKRRKELEDEFARQKDENNREVTSLAAERMQLLAKVEEQRKKIEDQTKELERTVEQCDVLERAKDSIRREKHNRDTELQAMKREFALSPKSNDHFKSEFVKTYSRIEGISLKYFNGIDGKDFDKIHEKLVAADPCFNSVPIDDSKDSRNLCIAHAQRIISNAICEYIWKPFSSEVTLSRPDFSDLLSKIVDELDKLSQGGRIPNVWTALTMRALQSLPADSSLAPASGFKESSHLTQPSRVEGVVSQVFSVLSPLVTSSQNEDLRRDLLELADLAIDVWNDAQAGDLKITISSLLERVHREEWRSQAFDPASPSGDGNETKLDTSTTHPRIFTLFPRVIAHRVADPVEHITMPGAWSAESDQATSMIQTCIHPGTGLPEWSSLVMRGKEEQQERKDFLSRAMEAAKELHNCNRRASGHGRRDSAGGSISGPSSPS